jgi:hypothetical protein
MTIGVILEGRAEFAAGADRGDMILARSFP